MGELAPGLTAETSLVVAAADTALSLGSGNVPVFGTPALVGLMESAAVAAVSTRLPPGQTSVGARIDVRHLAATPIGVPVRARAELVAVDGRRLVLQVSAWDNVEQIGAAIHERFVVDKARFLARAYSETRLDLPT